MRWVGKDSNSNDPRYNLLWELEGAVDRRKFSRRSLGCQGVLLDEDEDRLRYEIEYYTKNSRLLPSTQRGHKINPFQVRQDYLESAVPPSKEEFGLWDLD